MKFYLLHFFLIILLLSFFSWYSLRKNATTHNWEKNWEENHLDIEQGSIADLSESVATKSENTADVIPGIILIVGLLGTFIGLGLALDKASTILSSADMNNMDNSMSQLMGMMEGLGTKFKTSTWGLIAFLMLKFIFSRNQYSERRLNWVSNKVKSELDKNRIQKEEEIKKNQMDLLDAISTLSNDLISSQQEIGIKNAKLLTDLTEKQLDTFNKHNKDLSESSYKNHQMLITTLSSSNNDQISAINNLMKNLTDSQKDLNQNTNKLLNTLSDKQLESIKNLSEHLTNTQLKLNDKNTSLLNQISAQQLNSINNLSENLVNTQQKLNQQNANLLNQISDRQLTSINNLSENLVNTQQKLNQQNANLLNQISDKQLNSIKDLSESLITNHKNLSDSSNKLFNQLSNKQLEAMNNLSNRLENTQKELIRNISSSSHRQIQTLEAGYKEQQKVIQSMSNTLSSAFAHSMNNFIEQQLKSNQNNSERMTKQICSSIHTQQQQIISAVDKNSKYLEKTAQESQHTRNAMDKFVNENLKTIDKLKESAEGMSNAAKNIGGSASQLKTVIDSLSKEMNELMVEMNRGLGKTIENMDQSFVNNMKQMTQNLSKTIDDMNNSFKGNMTQMSNGLNKATTDISNAVGSLSRSVDNTMKNVTKTIETSMDLQQKSQQKFEITSQTLNEKVIAMTELVEQLKQDIISGLNSVSQSNLRMVSLDKRYNGISDQVEALVKSVELAASQSNSLKPLLQEISQKLPNNSPLLSHLTQIKEHLSTLKTMLERKSA